MAHECSQCQNRFPTRTNCKKGRNQNKFQMGCPDYDEFSRLCPESCSDCILKKVDNECRLFNYPLRDIFSDGQTCQRKIVSTGEDIQYNISCSDGTFDCCCYVKTCDAAKLVDTMQVCCRNSGYFISNFNVLNVKTLEQMIESMPKEDDEDEES